jgi:hypothetical protein
LERSRISGASLRKSYALHRVREKHGLGSRDAAASALWQPHHSLRKFMKNLPYLELPAETGSGLGYGF